MTIMTKTTNIMNLQPLETEDAPLTIEHPLFVKDKIPKGWERVTKGKVVYGDRVLIGTCIEDSEYIPWMAKHMGEPDVTQCPAGRKLLSDGLYYTYNAVFIRQEVRSWLEEFFG